MIILTVWIIIGWWRNIRDMFRRQGRVLLTDPIILIHPTTFSVWRRPNLKSTRCTLPLYLFRLEIQICPNWTHTIWDLPCIEIKSHFHFTRFPLLSIFILPLISTPHILLRLWLYPVALIQNFAVGVVRWRQGMRRCGIYWDTKGEPVQET
jgi:hypothetical protein